MNCDISTNERLILSTNHRGSRSTMNSNSPPSYQVFKWTANFLRHFFSLPDRRSQRGTSATTQLSAPPPGAHSTAWNLNDATRSPRRQVTFIVARLQQRFAPLDPLAYPIARVESFSQPHDRTGEGEESEEALLDCRKSRALLWILFYCQPGACIIGKVNTARVIVARRLKMR